MSRRIGFPILASGAAASFILSTSVLAAPTLDQLKLFMEQSSIPQWKNSASHIKNYVARTTDASAKSTWAELDAATDVASGKAPLNRATSPTDGKDLMNLSSWLRWRILSENADPRYSYAYASNLHYMRDSQGDYQKEAAIFFFHARLAMEIDGARCVDAAQPKRIASEIESQKRFQPLLAQLASTPERAKAFAMLEAVSIENMIGERPPLEALCAQGAQTILKALDAGRATEPASSTDSLGSVYSIDVAGVKPDLIASSQWSKKRKEIIDRATKSAYDILYPAAK